MKFQIPKGTTSKILRLFIQDSSQTDGRGLTGLVFNSANLVANYTREGDAAETAITLVTATEGTFTSSGFIQMDATDLPGMYELGLPDAALATGAESVLVMLKGAASMAPVVLEIQLTDPVRSPVVVDWGLLKQSTNRHLLIGPIIDIETGAPKTSLTLGDITAARVTQTGSTVTRTGMTLAGSGDNQFTHVGDGYWEIDLTTTDTATLGRLTVTVRDDDLFHPVSASALIVPAHVFDGIVSGSDNLQVDVVQWLGTAVAATTAGIPNVNMVRIANDADDAEDLGAAVDNVNMLVKIDVIRVSGDATAADNLEAAFDGTGYHAGGFGSIDVNIEGINGDAIGAENWQKLLEACAEPVAGGPFIVAVGTSSTSFTTNTGDATNDHYNGNYIRWLSGALKGAVYLVTDYVGATKTWTVPTMTDTPATNDEFELV